MPPANTFEMLPEAHCQAPATYYHLQVPTADGIFHLSPFLFLDQHPESPTLAGYQSMFNLTAPISPHSWGHPLATTSLPNPISHSSDSNHLKDRHPTSEDEADNSSFEFDDYLYHKPTTGSSSSQQNRPIPCPRSAREAYLMLEAT